VPLNWPGLDVYSKFLPAIWFEASSLQPQPPGSRGYHGRAHYIGKSRSKPYETAVTPTEGPLPSQVFSLAVPASSATLVVSTTVD
jgi:hypothetical protein